MPKTLSILQIAIVCHEANRAYCQQLGDGSQARWASAPDWQQASAIEGVKFNVANPDAPPSASHESWLAEKQRDGWKYGPEKDPVLKEHPCFVAYEELPLTQQHKDHLFKAVVAALAPLLSEEDVKDVIAGYVVDTVVDTDPTKDGDVRVTPTPKKRAKK